MHKTFSTFMLLVCSLLTFTACATAVEFKSLDIGVDGDPNLLTGKLKKPEGNGPFQ